MRLEMPLRADRDGAARPQGPVAGTKLPPISRSMSTAPEYVLPMKRRIPLRSAKINKSLYTGCKRRSA